MEEDIVVNDMNEDLLVTLDKASRVFAELINKLEDDKYISGSYEKRFSILLLEEIRELSESLARNIPLSEDENGEMIFPGGFMALCRFDRMAQEYSGAFWEKLHVTNPGRLTELYLRLLEANERIMLGKTETESLLTNVYSETVEAMRKRIESPYFD